MARRCELTGKAVLVGNTVSNANNRRRTRFLPHLTYKKIFVAELNRSVRIRLSLRALRTVDKLGGLISACRRYQKTLSPHLEKLLKEAS